MNMNINDILKSFTKTSESYESSSGNFFSFNSIITVAWLLAIYLIVYYILGIFYSPSSSDHQVIASRTFDFITLIFVLIVAVSTYYSNADQPGNDSWGENTWNSIKYGLSQSITLLYLFVIILLMYVVVYITGIPMTYDMKPISIKIFETVVWVLIAVCLLNVLCIYFLKMNIMDLITNVLEDIFSPFNSVYDTGNLVASGNTITYGNTIASGKSVTSSSPLTYSTNGKEEVFNIRNNLYTYDDAKAICKSYGARLATYDDIEDAYKKGSEWCSYSWTEGQHMYFVTQKETWNKLQGDSRTANKCGRPGINGGKNLNPNVKLGVACYGIKPKPKQSDLDYMKETDITYVPQTPEEIELDKKVKFWKENAHHMLVLNPFNRDKWSEW